MHGETLLTILMVESRYLGPVLKAIKPITPDTLSKKQSPPMIFGSVAGLFFLAGEFANSIDY